MLKDKVKEIGKHDKNNKKKIENIVFLIVLLVITIIAMNVILDGNNDSSEDENTTSKTLAENTDESSENDDLTEGLKNILSTIKGVGEVEVFINYSESSSIQAMYDETTTTSTTEETDSSGGVRNVIQTETQKEVIYSEEDGNKNPVTESVTMPVIEGAIITAQGASNATVKTNIVSAVEAATGLSKDKIQVFEKEN